MSSAWLTKTLKLKRLASKTNRPSSSWNKVKREDQRKSELATLAMRLKHRKLLQQLKKHYRPAKTLQTRWWELRLRIVIIIRAQIHKLSKTLIRYATFISSITRLRIYKRSKLMLKRLMRKCLHRDRNLLEGGLSGCRMGPNPAEISLIAKYLALWWTKVGLLEGDKILSQTLQ